MIKGLKCERHLLWLVSELSHQRPQVKQDQSPEKTGRNWVLLAAGRGPAAHGTCPWMIKDHTTLLYIQYMNMDSTFLIYCRIVHYSRLWGV